LWYRIITIITIIMSARSTSLVGTTNVEHLEQLSREGDALLQTSKQADRDREHALARPQKLSATLKMLSKELHVANETLRVLDRKGKALNKNEDARLQQGMHQERAEIQQCVDEGKGLRAGESQHKRDFCKRMETLNKELADLLMQREEMRLQKMIAVESAPVLLSHSLAKTTAVESENRDDFDKEVAAQANADIHAAIIDFDNLEDEIQQVRP
jgi:hypothetical protein